MKNILVLCILGIVALSSSSWSESVLKPLNEKGYGTVSGRVQSLSMYRDLDNGVEGANSTLGFILNYSSPEFAGFDAGLGYNYAGEIYEDKFSPVLLNDDISIMNELWGRYSFDSIDLTNTTITIGRRINNAEVFRADDYRQKSRSIEAIQAESTDVKDFRIAGGHAFKMSNWIQSFDRWEFNDFGDVFGTPYDSFGVTWAEANYTGLENMELVAFDAIAWDVANMLGGRLKYDVDEKTSVLGYLRFENDIGKAQNHRATVIGLSGVRKVGIVILEGGYFGVSGDSLRFQETTTGINHALGASMLIYSGQFSGDSDTIYLKANTTLKGPETALYALYNYTFLDGLAFDAGQELNLVAKQPIIENLTIAFKYGVGHKSSDLGDQTAHDARLFITYTF